MKINFLAGILICIFLVSGCASGNKNLGLANPASVYCEQNNGTSVTETAEDGSQTGYCEFSDSTRCDEWAYYRGECKPGYPNINPIECTQQCPEGTKVKCTEECPEGFCGISSNDPCTQDNECFASGCSGQICQSKEKEATATTCEYKDCYDAEKYNLECKCIDSKCQWY